jgi:hypothetical protein
MQGIIKWFSHGLNALRALLALVLTTVLIAIIGQAIEYWIIKPAAERGSFGDFVTSMYQWLLARLALLNLRIALGVLVGVPLLVALLVLVPRWRRQRAARKNAPDPRQVLIPVAEFYGPKPADYQVTEHLLNKLRATLKPYPDVELCALNETITEQQGSEVARTIGKSAEQRY